MGSPYLLALVIIAGLLASWYLATLLVAEVILVVHVQAIDEEIDDTQEEIDRYQRDFIVLDDVMLESATPKLRMALGVAPEFPTYDNGERQSYRVTLSGLEIDQINRILASTEKGKELIADGWDNDNKRGELLYPDDSSTVFVGYRGNEYQLTLLTLPFAFRIDTFNELGFLFYLIFFVIPLASAIVGGLVIMESAFALQRRGRYRYIEKGRRVVAALVLAGGVGLVLLSLLFLGLF